ncbi:MAG: hypothetical protein IJN08_03525 [Clostridia bacterium]|nr:hypothetical protein [Clostridia bacterium]
MIVIDFFSLSFLKKRKRKEAKEKEKTRENRKINKLLYIHYPKKPNDGCGFLCIPIFPKPQIRPPVEAEFAYNYYYIL